MINELRERYSKLSDRELLMMVYFKSSDYTNEAIEYASSVLSERGLSHPPDEILQQAKDYYDHKKESAMNYEDVFKEKKLKKAIKKRDYFFIGKWLFWFFVIQGFYTAFRGGVEKGWVALLPIYEVELISEKWLFVMGVAFNFAIFGIIPVAFFLIHSFKLSSEQRKEKGLSLFMPKYVLFIYCIALFLFVALIIIPRL